MRAAERAARALCLALLLALLLAGASAQAQIARRHDYTGCRGGGEAPPPDRLGDPCRCFTDRGYREDQQAYPEGLVVHFCIVARAAPRAVRLCGDDLQFDPARRACVSSTPPVPPARPCVDASSPAEVCLAQAETARLARRHLDALHHYEAACAAPRPELRACQEAGTMYRDGSSELPARPLLALARFERACVGGLGTACQLAAEALAAADQGPDVAAHGARAADFLSRGCSLGDFTACGQLADRAVAQEPGFVGVVSPSQFYDFACANGVERACIAAARQRGLRGGPEGAVARAELTRSCRERGDLARCAARDDVVCVEGAPDEVDALCVQEAVPCACAQHARNLSGRGLFDAGRDLMRVGCDAGRAEHCATLGDLLLRRPRDLSAAEAALVRAGPLGAGRLDEVQSTRRLAWLPGWGRDRVAISIEGGVSVPLGSSLPVVGVLRSTQNLWGFNATFGLRLPTLVGGWITGFEAGAGVHVLSWPRFDRASWSIVNPVVGIRYIYHPHPGGGPDEDHGGQVTLSNALFAGCLRLNRNDQEWTAVVRVEGAYPFYNGVWFPPSVMVFLGVGQREMTGWVNAGCHYR
jgi:TPR repeat protein